MTINTPTKTNHRSFASLGLPKPVGGIITVAHGIVTAMTGNASFPTPTPTLAVVMAAITDLQNAETAALARTRGAAITRNEKKTALVTLLQQLKGYVQTVADANVENGASIIASAGLAVRRTPAHKPRVFTAKPGAVSGSAQLVAASAGRRASYEWEYSRDNPNPTDPLQNKGDLASKGPIESPRLDTASDEPKRADTAPGTERMGVDEAIRVAAKAAIDAGEWVKARALLDLLDVGAKPRGTVVDLGREREKRR